jgi:hypothetical protein
MVLICRRHEPPFVTGGAGPPTGRSALSRGTANRADVAPIRGYYDAGKLRRGIPGHRAFRQVGQGRRRRAEILHAGADAADLGDARKIVFELVAGERKLRAADGDDGEECHTPAAQTALLQNALHSM